MTFRQNYLFEGTTTFFDGGVLEISIGGGAFQDIIAAGGSFVTGGYTGTISSSFSNPLAGRQAWGASSNGFITTTVNLPPAAAGQNIVLRWRMGSDTSGSGSGWRVDSIVLYAPGTACPAVSPTPTSTATATPTATATATCYGNINGDSHTSHLRLRPQQRSRLLQQRLLQREPRLRRQHAHRA